MKCFKGPISFYHYTFKTSSTHNDNLRNIYVFNTAKLIHVKIKAIVNCFKKIYSDEMYLILRNNRTYVTARFFSKCIIAL